MNLGLLAQLQGDMVTARSRWEQGLALARQVYCPFTLAFNQGGMDRGDSNRFPAYPAPDTLTTRELEALRPLAAGRSNKAIAATLVMSIRTVERHVANLYDKLSRHSKGEAIAFAIEAQPHCEA
ncbi:MAG: response regulator transcription factor [Dehalococcoidia bacterium]